MKKKRPSFGAVREDLACVLALSLRKTHYICFYRLFWLSNFFEHVLLLLEIETKLIKFCTKLQVKQAKVLLSNCTSLLQCSDPGQLNRLHFFKNFKTKCTLQGLKTLIKPFEAPQRNLKIKVQVYFCFNTTFRKSRRSSR